MANLDQELQDKLEEERIAAEEAARKAAEEEAARLAAEQAAREAEEAAQQQAQQQESGDEGGDGGSSVDYSGDWRSVVVSAAYSRVGCSYVYAAGGPNSFDCSGLTSWCYAQAGIGIGHSSGSQSGFCTKPASQAVAGDIVWRPGHVGICIGNGQTIEAFSPGQGVGFGSVYSFQTAGSPVG
ncbi:MAG: C40 family peptidase [Atopobiaceae bacterium]|nr:C40 family peptidase [Atopobiaceae bacterium]